MNNLDNHFDDFDPDSNYFDDLISENQIFTSFDSVDDFLMHNSISLQEANYLSIFSQNIRSFNKNLDNFLLLFNDFYMPDVLVFSETWKHFHNPVILPGYTGYHTVRDGRSGGISIFIKSSIDSEIIQKYSYANSSIEICTVKVTNGSSSLYIFGIYRPVTGDFDSFNLCLENILSDRNLINQIYTFIGAFNANMLFYDIQIDISILVDVMQSHHYIHVISDVTRRGNDHTISALIYLIWTNQLINFNSGVIKTGVTDHHTTFIQIPFVCNKKHTDKIKIHFRDCSANYHEIFQNNIENYNWDSLKSHDVDTYTYNFINALNSIFQKSFPLKMKEVTVKYFNNPWHTPELKKLADARVKYHDLYRKGLVTHDEYSQFRNKVTAIIRKCKIAYYERCSSRHAGNMKESWKMIRKVCYGTSDKCIESIIVDGNILKCPNAIAEKFNHYFVNIANDLANNLPHSNNSPYQFVEQNDNILTDFEPVTLAECSNVIKNLKNTKHGPNVISVELFKKYAYFFLPIICNLINLSFTTGIFPDYCKQAIIRPFTKKGTLMT